MNCLGPIQYPRPIHKDPIPLYRSGNFKCLLSGSISFDTLVAYSIYKIRRFKRKGKKLLNNKNLPASMATDDAHLNAQEALALGDQGAEEPASMATDDAHLNAQEALALGDQGAEGFDFDLGLDVELEQPFADFNDLTLLHDNLQELRNHNQTLSNLYGEHITRTRRKKLKKKITKSTAVVRKVMGELDYDFDEIYPDAIFVDVDHVDYHGRYVHWIKF